MSTKKPTVKKKTAVKKAPTKAVKKPAVKKPAVKKPAKKKAIAPVPAPAEAVPPPAPEPTPAPPAPEVAPFAAPLPEALEDYGQVTPIAHEKERRNGVTRPRPGTISRQLWDAADELREKLGRPPARFEFRAVTQAFKSSSAVFQFFQWRKFHGIAGRATGIYPKQRTFQPSTPRVPKTAK